MKSEKSRNTLNEIIVEAVGKQLEQAARYDHVLLDREMSYAACLEVAKAVVEEGKKAVADLYGRLPHVNDRTEFGEGEAEAYRTVIDALSALAARASGGGR